MEKNRYDYSELLDNLRFVLRDYRMNSNREIININNEIVKDKKITADYIFAMLYLLMYEYYKGYGNGTYQYSEIQPKNVGRALSDYNLFNDMMNSVVPEFAIFGILFTDVSEEFELLPFFLHNEERRRIITSYLENEKVNINRIMKSQKSRKRK